MFNNVIYNAISQSNLALIAGSGTFNMHHNWIKEGWQDCFCSPEGSIVDDGDNLTGLDPMFSDYNNQLFRPQQTSPLVNNGDLIPVLLQLENDVVAEYVKHQGSVDRPISGQLDIGAFEYSEPVTVVDLEIMNGENNIVSIFPNPTSGAFVVESEGTEIKEIVIYNHLGEEVHKSFIETIDITNQPTGIYLAKIILQSGESVVKRIVKW